MKLSIILPGIRPHNWFKLYNSIPNATTLPKEEYELVIVSPYDLPPELQNLNNVSLIKDKGCPTRCTQIGLLHSKGEFVSWGADDGVMSPGVALDKAFAIRPQHYKGIVALRYSEDYKSAKLEKLSWWYCKRHPLLRNLKFIPNHYMLIMSGLVSREYLVELGGWDCRFEQPGISNVDLTVRLQNDGAESVLGEKAWDLRDDSGCGKTTTGPVVDAHVLNDAPLLKSIYSHKSSRGRSRIDIDNWKQAPAVWSRRFGQGG